MLKRFSDQSNEVFYILINIKNNKSKNFHSKIFSYEINKKLKKYQFFNLDLILTFLII